jgi:small subunit ribosomal protein S14
MAKECVKARQVKREKLVAKYADKRAELKKAGNYAELSKMPRNTSAVRLRNRCKMTGRPRGYIRQFGVCRNVFREMALMGKIPGVTKSSW